MARLLNAQRRAFIFVAAITFTLLIRLISFSVRSSSTRFGRSGVVLSDRGSFKQVAFRIAKLHSKRALNFPFRLGFHDAEPSTSYLIRLANFYPFIMLENLGVYGDINAVTTALSYESMLCQSCGDSDGDGDGGGGDGDGDSSDGYS
jgi:hypothetical protein